MTSFMVFRQSVSNEFKRYLIRYRTLKITSQKQEACLTNCNQLSLYIEEPKKYRVLDATWDLDKNNLGKHMSERIPNSRFFDIWECKDKNSPIPMMLPSKTQFEDYVSDLGVSSDHHLIIYDNQDDFVLFSACRLWWMFRVFGHDNVSVLNGGMKRWVQEGYATCSGDYSETERFPEPTKKFKATFQPKRVKDFNFIKKNSISASPSTILEARSPAMMGLDDDETDITSKSVPGALLSPFTQLLDKENNTILSKDEINQILANQNIDLSKEVTATCEVGLTASILSYCIYYATGKDVSVYDGSMSEWQVRNA